VRRTTGHFEPDRPAASPGHPGKKLSLQGLTVTTDKSPFSKWSIPLMTGPIHRISVTCWAFIACDTCIQFSSRVWKQMTATLPILTAELD
jgi:hypothetical protein